MRDIELGTEVSGQDGAAVEHYAGSNANPDLNHIEMAGLRLPPPGSTRWWPHRKAAVVTAVRCGFLSLDDACERYALSIEEFLSWQQGIDLLGLAGLRASGPRRRRAGDSSAD